jgi:hypothetical protein
MPNLHNLALTFNMVSIFGDGFKRFIVAHGSNTQLGLRPLSQCLPSYHHVLDEQVSRTAMATWCPNLTEFICTADEDRNEAEFIWTPHALLPAQPNIKIISIQNLDQRIVESIEAEKFRWLVEKESFPSLRTVEGLSTSLDRATRTALQIPITPTANPVPKFPPPQSQVAPGFVCRVRTAFSVSVLTNRLQERHPPSGCERHAKIAGSPETQH